MNSLIYDFQQCYIRKGDQTLSAGIKPEFTFAYDALAYDSISLAKYQHENAEYTLTEAEITEVEDYIASVTPDATTQNNMDSLMYLAETDWYVTRHAETGVAVPADVTAARTAARLAIVSA